MYLLKSGMGRQPPGQPRCIHAVSLTTFRTVFGEQMGESSALRSAHTVFTKSNQLLHMNQTKSKSSTTAAENIFIAVLLREGRGGGGHSGNTFHKGDLNQAAPTNERGRHHTAPPRIAHHNHPHFFSSSVGGRKTTRHQTTPAHHTPPCARGGHLHKNVPLCPRPPRAQAAPPPPRGAGAPPPS